jgi:hypothetical protein
MKLESVGKNLISNLARVEKESSIKVYKIIKNLVFSVRDNGAAPNDLFS